MQLQTFEGYYENERFIPTGVAPLKSGRHKVILTFLNDPTHEMQELDYKVRMERHKELKTAIALLDDEDFPDLIRSKEIRPLLDWES